MPGPEGYGSPNEMTGDEHLETRESILARFDELIRQGQQAMATDRADDDEYVRIRTSGMNLVRRTCGAESDHYLALERIASDKEDRPCPASC